MLIIDVIEPAQTAGTLHIFFVSTKDKNIRFCVDNHMFNAVKVRDLLPDTFHGRTYPCVWRRVDIFNIDRKYQM